VSGESSFIELCTRLKAGEDAAASELFQRYSQQLIRLASPRLKGLLRQKVDPEDIVQSAMGSFFRANAQGSFDLSGWNDLWCVLVTITLRKCRYQVRRFLSIKRDIRREQGAVEAAAIDGFSELASPPTPAEAAELADLLGHLLAVLDDRGRSVVQLCLENYTPDEIAAQVGLAPRSVYRVLARIRDQLEQLEAAPAQE
jgi:RNA polymerase sigma-70 factor (ECF subfamily)